MKTLVVQRGHCFRKSGATGTAGEQENAVRVAKAIVGSIPEGWAVKVIDADEADSAYIGDAFVAIHCDGSPDPAVRGASVGYQSEAGAAFAQRWKTAYRTHGFPGTFRRDNYTDALAGYYGVRKAVAQGNRVAIIIECGFLTNATERAWIVTHPDAIAASVWGALVPGNRKRLLTTMGARKHSRWLSRIVGKVYAGRIYTVIEPRNGWSRIKGYGVDGWVPSRRLR